MKFRSEKALWSYLAEIWEHPFVFQYPDRLVSYTQICGESCESLCVCLAALWGANCISLALHDRALKRMHANRPRGCKNDDYWWQLTEQAAKQRAAFCSSMVEQCSQRERLRR
jgi:hypothetical protein